MNRENENRTPENNSNRSEIGERAETMLGHIRQIAEIATYYNELSSSVKENDDDGIASQNVDEICDGLTSAIFEISYLIADEIRRRMYFDKHTFNSINRA